MTILEQYKQAEQSIVKKYKKAIWNRFIGGIKDYRLIEEGDRIAVCISGGKDSMLLAKCMQRLQKYSEFPFSVKYIVMDPGYNEANRKQITDNAALLGIPVEIFDTNIFRVVKWGEGSPCYLCARMRRGHLYRAAKEAGCNKIALGHHFDDVIETILMSMLYGGEIKTMMPKLHSTNFEGMELIRPLYLVREQDIISWARYNGLQFIRCACRFTENLSNEDALGHSKRAEVKQLLAELRKRSGYIDRNIFSSVHHIILSTVIGYKEGEDEPVHTFLETYERDSQL